MAKFDSDQVADVLAIKQVLYEWLDELDVRDGLSMMDANVLTEDCRYNVGGEWREGRAGAAKFYRDRFDRLTGEGAVPVMRHMITNEKVTFTSDTEAKADFLLLFFTKAGDLPIMGYCDPVAFADVWMGCRKEADGHWRISKFDSQQVFINA